VVLAAFRVIINIFELAVVNKPTNQLFSFIYKKKYVAE